MIEITFQEGDTKSFDKLLKEHMEKPLKHYEKELASIRTGRASVTVLENIKVDVYGQMMSLRELATLSAPDARLLTVQPWDKSILPDIEKAISLSDLGATPVNDGAIIRIQLPQMSASRRDELLKILGKKTEECRVGVRNVRKDFQNEVRDAEKKRLISEDFGKKLSDVLQKTTDLFIDKTEQLHKKKETEIGHI
ncbi:ribosome recycling factor [Candidatus Dependentiae bacterium]|nr:ribosome recycling factor [Candidatus Dependentiae bacterium]